jgi:hypothetical protein
MSYFKKVFTSPRKKNEVDDVNKDSETVCALKCTGDVVYLIPLKKPIPIDVVAVNYAVFAISIFITYYM